MNLNILSHSKVTGSCYWLYDEKYGWNFLVDCGMRQGECKDREWNRGELFLFNPVDLQFVILTHAHLDHCGMIPWLVKNGFCGPVYATIETKMLAREILKDAGKLGAAYSQKDIDRINWQEPVSGLKKFNIQPVGPDLFLNFSPNGHIMGSVSVRILWGKRGLEQRSINFSGDLGPNFDGIEHLPLSRRCHEPTPADFAVVESTYGCANRNSEENSFESRIQQLREIINQTCMKRGGRLLIPAFALDRTQQILFDLTWIVACNPEIYADLPIFLDSPLASKVNKIYAKGMESTGIVGKKIKVRWLWLNKKLFDWFGLNKDCDEHNRHLRAMLQTMLGENKKDVLALPSEEFGPVSQIVKNWRRVWGRVDKQEGELPSPAILVVGGGMLEGGRGLRYLNTFLQDAKSTILLTGYQASRSLGKKLVELAQLPLAERQKLTNTIRWKDGDQPYELPAAKVFADILILKGYSAHADQEGLLRWLVHEYKGKQCQAGRTVIVSHGNESSQEELKNAILKKGTFENVIVPNECDHVFDLDFLAARQTGNQISMLPKTDASSFEEFMATI